MGEKPTTSEMMPSNRTGVGDTKVSVMASGWKVGGCYYRLYVPRSQRSTLL